MQILSAIMAAVAFGIYGPNPQRQSLRMATGEHADMTIDRFSDLRANGSSRGLSVSASAAVSTPYGPFGAGVTMIA